MKKKKEPDKKGSAKNILVKKEFKNKIDEYEKSLKTYKTVKTSLKSVIKNDIVLDTINETVIKMNKIVIHTYQFLKLFCLHKFDKGGTLPELNSKFIVLIMKTVATSDKKGKSPTEISQNF